MILLLGVPCLIGAVVASIAGTVTLRNNAVADGRAPGTLSFGSERKRYVIALSAKPDGIFDGLNRTERRRRFRVRESDASQARCTIAHPGTVTEILRGTVWRKPGRA